MYASTDALLHITQVSTVGNHNILRYVFITPISAVIARFFVKFARDHCYKKIYIKYDMYPPMRASLIHPYNLKWLFPIYIYLCCFRETIFISDQLYKYILSKHHLVYVLKCVYSLQQSY